MIRHRQDSVDGSSQFILPFAEKEYVTVRRTAHILGVSQNTVYRLAGLRGRDGRANLQLVDYGFHARQRVLYSSIVSFCDGLRARFLIADRRPPLSHPMFRHKDEDLLPFPMGDTVYSAEAMAALGYDARGALVRLIEEGRFEAYRLLTIAPWRISRSSFVKFLNELHGRDEQPKIPAAVDGALTSQQNSPPRASLPR
jgi:hypothetical protein